MIYYGALILWDIIMPMKILEKRGKKILCECQCGTIKEIWHGNHKKTHSCGCLTKGHGMTGHPYLKTWWHMKARCFNKDNLKYNDYGGRGITVCDEWLDACNFIAYLENMGERPDGWTMDRIDNNGNYEPGNIRWASLTTQANNKRNIKQYKFDGLELTLTGWSNQLGIKFSTLYMRIHSYGWSIDKALSTPVGG